MLQFLHLEPSYFNRLLLPLKVLIQLTKKMAGFATQDQ